MSIDWGASQPGNFGTPKRRTASVASWLSWDENLGFDDDMVQEVVKAETSTVLQRTARLLFKQRPRPHAAGVVVLTDKTWEWMATFKSVCGAARLIPASLLSELWSQPPPEEHSDNRRSTLGQQQAVYDLLLVFGLTDADDVQAVRRCVDARLSKCLVTIVSGDASVLCKYPAHLAYWGTRVLYDY